MISISRAAITFFLFVPTALAWSQQSPENASAQASSPPGEVRPTADGASSRTLRVLNADGSPAAGAKVLVGDAHRLRTIFNGQLLQPPETGGGMGEMSMMGGGMDEMMMAMGGGRSRREAREVTWRQTDQKGHVELSGLDLSIDMEMGMGPGMEGYGREAVRLPPLFIRDDHNQFAFLPPGSERQEFPLKKGAELKVRVPDAKGISDHVVLAWWNNGFALPRQLHELGYKKSNLDRNDAVGWKFHSYFAVFETESLAGDPFADGPSLDDPFAGGPSRWTANLVVPPGEVRLTMVPKNELEAFNEEEAALDYSQLIELALYAGPSRIVSAGSGEQKVVQFDNVTHSIQLQMRSSNQPLPQWEGTRDEDTAVFLVRELDVELPGGDQSELKPGSRTHERLLGYLRSFRSQLPPVRVGRQVSPGTYRFDLLPPGTYRVRVGKRSDLQGTPPASKLGEPVRVRPIAQSPVDTYAISFEPDGGGWDETLVIEPAQSEKRIEPPFVEDPFGGLARIDPFAQPPLDGPGEQDTSPRHRRLRELKVRIRRLQQQLEAAARLVDELEAEAGAPSR